jgi:hypothetical protein
MEIDREVFEVEQRIARRRAEIAYVGREAGRRALQSLTSPIALGVAVGAGFLAGGLMGRRRRTEPKFVERRRSMHRRKTGIAGMLAAGALSLLRARYGTPMALAQVVLSRLRKPPRPAA